MINTIKNYTDGTLYKNREAFSSEEFRSINVAPSYPIFAARADDEFRFDAKLPYQLNQNRLFDAINKGIITEKDKIILSLIATFSPLAITTKMVSELLLLIGAYQDSPSKLRSRVDSSVKRLFGYGLIDFGKFYTKDSDRFCTTRFITLAPYGYRLVKGMGLSGFYYNGFNISTRTPAEVKRLVSTAQVVVEWLKHYETLSFTLRKMVEYSKICKDAYVKPCAAITVGTAELPATIYLESIRRTPESNFIDKLKRYELVFQCMEKREQIVLIAEDFEHSKEIYDTLVENGVNTDNLIFTHDLLIADDFHNAFYSFENGEKVSFCL